MSKALKPNANGYYTVAYETRCPIVGEYVARRVFDTKAAALRFAREMKATGAAVFI